MDDFFGETDVFFGEVTDPKITFVYNVLTSLGLYKDQSRNVQSKLALSARLNIVHEFIESRDIDDLLRGIGYNIGRYDIYGKVINPLDKTPSSISFTKQAWRRFDDATRTDVVDLLTYSLNPPNTDDDTHKINPKQPSHNNKDTTMSNVQYITISPRINQMMTTIIVRHRNSNIEKYPDKKSEFWLNLRDFSMRTSPQRTDWAKSSVEQMEGDVEQNLGRHLKQKMMEQLTSQMEILERSPEYSLQSGPKNPDPAIKISNDQAKRREYGSITRKIEMMSNVQFEFQIAGYESMLLTLTITGAKQLLNTYNNNPELLEAALRTLIPGAFASMLDSNAASWLTFSMGSVSMNLPQDENNKNTIEQPVDDNSPPTTINNNDSKKASQSRITSAISQPGVGILLALIISLVIALIATIDFRSSQYEAMKPILEHQAKLLEEDRARMATSSVMEQKIIDHVLLQLATQSSIPITPIPTPPTATPVTPVPTPSP